MNMLFMLCFAKVLLDAVSRSTGFAKMQTCIIVYQENCR